MCIDFNSFEENKFFSNNDHNINEWRKKSNEINKRALNL